MSDIRSLDDAQLVLRQFYLRPGVSTLDRMRALMQVLGNPQDKLRVIHVAGTSGKTSTCYFIASLLQAAGLKTGLTVSPHVDTVNERVQIGLEPLAEADFCRELGEFLDIVAASGVQPSYFEVMIAFAYWEFVRQGIDYAVVEVGLGGLLDGTNVVSRPDKLCVITDIGLDHTEILGDTLAKIAAQKAGIILPGNDAFMFDQGQEVMTAVNGAVADAAESHLHLVAATAKLPPESNLPLFQQRNLTLAEAVTHEALHRLGRPDVTPDQLQRAAQVYIPARMEIVEHAGKTFIVDGAHNAQKLQTLFQSIQDRFPNEAMAGLVGFVEGDRFRLEQALDMLMQQLQHMTITSFYTEKDYPRHSVDPAVVEDYCRQSSGWQQTEVVPEPAGAFEAVLRRPEKLIVITGSFYLLNHIRPLLMKEAS